MFHLTRRTSANLVVELYLDVGTWSHSVTAIFIVQGAGFKGIAWDSGCGGGIRLNTRLGMRRSGRIVENLAAMVKRA